MDYQMYDTGWMYHPIRIQMVLTGFSLCKQLYLNRNPVGFQNRFRDWEKRGAWRCL